MGRFNRGANTNLIYIFCDCFFGTLAYGIALLVTYAMGETVSIQNYFIVSFSFMVLFILANKESRLYNVTTFFYVDRIIKRVSKSYLIATGVTSTLLFYVGRAKISRLYYITFLVAAYILLLSSAFLVKNVIMKKITHAPRTLLIGEIEGFKKFERFLSKSNLEIDIIGYVNNRLDKDENENIEADDKYLGNIQDLENIIHENSVDQIYIMQGKHNQIDIQVYLNMCMEMGVTVRIIMNAYKAGAAQTYVSSVGTYPILTYHTVSLNRGSKAMKRMIDILGSLVGIILGSPIMLITALAIKLDSPGPVIFKQERVGQNGRRFHIYKFRSMCIDAEEKKKQLMEQNEMDSNFMFKMQDDPRITKVGKFIRKTSIDELPQFFNVLVGEMSLVGTRPPTVDEVEMYERNHWRRISIKPGITGMWQVSGRSSITDFDEIVELDTQYIDRWNVLLDFQIILKTILQVFLHKGAC